MRRCGLQATATGCRKEGRSILAGGGGVFVIHTYASASVLCQLRMVDPYRGGSYSEVKAGCIVRRSRLAGNYGTARNIRIGTYSAVRSGWMVIRWPGMAA